MSESIISCPVCGRGLGKFENCFKCENGHSFDLAKEGYVNLLSGAHKQGELIGDNKTMASSRRDFLNKGYFSSLSKAVLNELQLTEKENPNVLDICCGEGYYSNYITQRYNCRIYGFDISKNMIRLAAKRKINAEFFVANLSHIPVFDSSVDFAFHLFAPFHAGEFARVLKDDGILVTAYPGENHLWELKEAIYDVPYKNDEKMPEHGTFELLKTVKVKEKIFLDSNADIISLFKMTPYYYHTSKEGIERAERLEKLETQLEFVLAVFRK